MYARLWWKDVRQFWPIWVFLALAAAVVQGLLLHYLGRDARQGLLGLSALLCASLYAFAAGAAAFAGEREAGTLGLLDILPVDRRVVWAGKVSFALVTTLALTLVLLAMAAMSTDRWMPQGVLAFWVALGFGMIVLVALGWGLFWSAILSNALTAAVTAICCTVLSLSFLVRLVEMDGGRGLPIVAQLFVILATVIASDVIFTRAMRWRQVQFEFRSPVVVTRAESASARRVQLQIQSPVATVVSRRAAAGTPESLVTDQSPRRSWVVEARALAWQTMKEGGRTWCLLAAIGLGLPMLIFLRFGYLDFALIVILSIGVALVAGASVFGLENRMRTHRFLTHHGARPGLIWLVKLAVWSLGLAVIWGPLALMTKNSMEKTIVRGIENWLLSVLIIPLFFGVAQLCGMALRRGITAVVIALVIGLALVIPLGALVVAHMLPVQGLLVIPIGLLAVSWAWSGDWLLDRPAPGRWLCLGLLLTGTFALLLGWYAGFRAWSLPDVGPITAPQAWTDAAARPLPAEQNAADLYRQAEGRLVGPDTDSPEFLNRNREALDLVRRAAARPDCRFRQPDTLTLVDPTGLPPIERLALLVTLDLQDRQKRGDLAGAWDDIVVLFRMARHFGEGAGLYPAFSVVSVQRDALGLAMEWAVARGQTPERLHAALTAYRDLPKMPPPADVVRVEANLVEKTLDLPTSKFRDWLYESMNGPRESERVLASALLDVVMTPWERTRARRLNRLVSAAAIQFAMREPWQRSGRTAGGLDDAEIRYAQTTTPLAMLRIIPPTGSYLAALAVDDHNEVAWRALVQIIALRAWQRRHGGQFPDRLDALVPEELPSLPTDPYSGRPFGYVRADGQVVSSLRFALRPAPGELQAPAKGSWLLYSVGPDGHDDGGMDNGHRSQPMDIVFAIPPVEGDSGAGKGKGQDGAEDRPAPPASRPSPPGPGR
ncbi:MAG: hypothetical protein ACHRXM_18440 [Isosphaerales bacterium]